MAVPLSEFRHTRTKKLAQCFSLFHNNQLTVDTSRHRAREGHRFASRVPPYEWHRPSPPRAAPPPVRPSTSKDFAPNSL